MKNLIVFIGLGERTSDEIIKHFKPRDYDSFIEVFNELLKSGYFQIDNEKIKLNDKGREKYYIYQMGWEYEKERY